MSLSDPPVTVSTMTDEKRPWKRGKERNGVSGIAPYLPEIFEENPASL